MPAESIRLDSLSRLIASESGFIFAFNASQINPGQKITVPAAIKRLDDLLAYLKEQYRLGYKAIGNHIILFKDTPLTIAVKLPSRKLRNYLPQKKAAIFNKEKTAGVQSSKKSTAHSTTLPDITPEITPLILPKKISNPPVKPDIPELKSPVSLQGTPIDFYGKEDNNPKGKSIHNIHFRSPDNSFSVSAGLTTSEILYVNPKLRAGLPWLFALAGWGTNFKTFGFFYGIGTRIKLSDSWDFQLSASRGTLSKDFRWPTPTSDTIGRIKTTLTRIDILVEKHLNKRWVVQFGPVLNLTKSKYSLIDPTTANSLPSGYLIKDIKIINPPYTLSNHYKRNTDSRKKMWVGLQIGLFYMLW